MNPGNLRLGIDSQITYLIALPLVKESNKRGFDSCPSGRRGKVHIAVEVGMGGCENSTLPPASPNGNGIGIFNQ